MPARHRLCLTPLRRVLLTFVAMFDSPLALITVLLAVSVFVVTLARRLGLPTILGYVAVGLAMGPHAAGVFPESETTHLLAELGVAVDLLAMHPVKRSHSVCAQGGINGAVNLRGEGDSPYLHFEDTITGGDFLNHQPPVMRMAERAPAIIYLLDRMGVPFNRTMEGYLDRRRFGGTLYKRTAFAGATTGQQLLYALDEQVRRW